MKDEEMAEEYLQGIEGDDCVIITDREERKQAFLAGLKAGRQPIGEAVEIIRELGGIVHEGVVCHYLTDCELILHRATLFLKEIEENGNG